MESIKKANAVLLINSQPPHLGELLQFIQQLNKYEFIYVCITGNIAVIALDHVLAIWRNILAPYSNKSAVMFFQKDIYKSSREDFPGAFKDCVWLTADRATYVHLSTLQVNVELIPRAMGYRGTFLRVAFRQSKALDYLEANYGGQIKR